ncbi:MAG: TolC family protein [Muribaculaceae bacterium]|nr:TolC family protein [Muribaculaceae bacterium]
MTRTWIAAVCAAAALTGAAQSRDISLDETIAIARTGSVEAAVALNELKTAYWEYRTFRADLLPEVNFAATLPSYRKNYSPYQTENGAYTFVRNNVLEMSGNVSIDQSIWLTGGTLSLTTSLDYMRQLGGGGSDRFMSVPVALTLNQPIFGTNHTKWSRRIEPVRYDEAKAAFMSATEEVAMKAVNYFFSLLMAKENLGTARQNMANAEKLHTVAVAKRQMGQISENDLLQLELNLLTARSTLTDTESDYKSAMFQLRSFLGMDESVELVPLLPERIPQADVAYGDVLERALERNSFARNIRRRQLEADYEVAKAKGDMREVTLFAQVGFTGTAERFRGAYDPLKDNQVVEVGFKIPIVDWGKRRGKVKVAESNREVVASRLRQEEMNFRQDIFMLVERFNNQKQQLDIAAASDTIAQQRYHTNVETFMIGKISTLDLNDSQSRKDESRQAYVNQLFQYWYYYYQLRSLTLWDYAAGTGIDADIERIVKD